MVRRTRHRVDAKTIDINKLPEKDKVAAVMQMFNMYYEDLTEQVRGSETLEELKRRLENIPVDILKDAMGEADMLEAQKLAADSRVKYGVDKNVLSFDNGQEIFNFLKYASWIKAARMQYGVH